MSWEYLIRREHQLPVTPEQLWQAVATDAGNRGWLYPMEIEPRVGGRVSRGPATVLHWEPPAHFACRHTDEETGFSNTLSYRIEPGPDTGSTLRFSIHWQHPGAADDNWNLRADAATRHSDFYHHSLAEYLRHFAPRPAHYIRAYRPGPDPDPDAFPRLLDRLGVPADATAGDRVALRPDGLPALDAVLDHRSPDFLGLRTEDGLYRFFNGHSWNWPTWLGHHLFDESTDPDEAAHRWTEWLTKTS